MTSDLHLETASCPRCDTDDSAVVLRGRDHLHALPGVYFVSECRHCRFWFQNPRVPLERLADLYPPEYAPHARSRAETAPLSPGQARYLRRRLGYAHLRDDEGVRVPRSGHAFDWFHRWRAGVDLIPRYVAGARLLEIGCGSGARLVTLRHLGWRELYGIEPVERAAAEARAAGFPVECDPVEISLGRYSDAALDVVVASMVLEHLANPFRVVDEIADKLRPGGEFLFSTVVRDSLDGRLYGEYWSGFDFPRHLVYFRRSDVLRMLAARFDVVECYHQSAPVDFVRASTWRLERGRTIDRLIPALARRRAGGILGLALAWLKLTSRVSLRCHRRPADAGRER